MIVPMVRTSSVRSSTLSNRAQRKSVSHQLDVGARRGGGVGVGGHGPFEGEKVYNLTVQSPVPYCGTSSVYVHCSRPCE